ncbi:sensor histidine kinase [Tenggerimyces flavus]|uniref:histidine kinase n=1 Tax=Tenggerimyces flavus TaxID=1708749 RepID=A0ABV7YBD5_9ACTN|nr:ATP-binding protein [Tenggerimyces flavus]MBM7789771.1 signal transduction histidine kinase [Tenggerimyces flavus]
MSRRASVRVRLTLGYAATFFVVSSVLIAATYVLVRNQLLSEYRRLNVFDLKGGLQLPPEKIVDFRPDGTPVTMEELRTRITEQQELALQTTTTNLLGISVAVALVGGLLALVVCWLLAGRAIRPLAMINDTAESIAGSSLDRRIRMSGPPDELKRLADTFDAMLERLDRSFDGQRRFVGNASHELRTPLAVTRTLVQVAMSRPGASADLQELGSTLLDINTQQARLTDALLTLARSEQALTAVVPVDVGSVVLGVLARHRDAASSSGVAVHPNVRVAVVPGDAVLLAQLVQNLVSNAFHYNHRDGSVVVSVLAAGGQCRLIVENTGPVVSEASELFEPFRRIGTPRVNGQAGVGLGLSIVRSIAHAHGGEVLATPRAAGGLTVTVTLPMVRPD